MSASPPHSMGKTKGTPARRRDRGLGKALMRKAHVSGRDDESEEQARAIQLAHARREEQARGNQFDSVVERNDLDEFVELADLANTDFSAARRAPVILSSTTKVALKQPSQQVHPVHGLRIHASHRLPIDTSHVHACLWGGMC